MMRVISIAVLAFGLTACGAETEVKETIGTEQTNVVVGEEAMQTGDYKDYHENGKLKTEGFLFEGNRTGVWKSYLPSGVLASENEYKAGVLEGKSIVYYRNGLIRYVGYYHKGQRDGKWQFFKEDGDLDRMEDFSKKEEQDSGS